LSQAPDFFELMPTELKKYKGSRIGARDGQSAPIFEIRISDFEIQNPDLNPDFTKFKKTVKTWLKLCLKCVKNILNCDKMRKMYDRLGSIL
jgi:hypothetical protein